MGELLTFSNPASNPSSQFEVLKEGQLTLVVPSNPNGTILSNIVNHGLGFAPLPFGMMYSANGVLGAANGFPLPASFFTTTSSAISSIDAHFELRVTKTTVFADAIASDAWAAVNADTYKIQYYLCRTKISSQ